MIVRVKQVFCASSGGVTSHKRLFHDDEPTTNDLQYSNLPDFARPRAVECTYEYSKVQYYERRKSGDWKLEITFEYTARGTTQQNSEAKVVLFVIANNRGRTMMIAANVLYRERCRFFREMMSTAILLNDQQW